MGLQDYWYSLPMAQKGLFDRMKQEEKEAYAEEHGLLIHGGKFIKPEDYPCACEKQSPYDCFDQLEDCAEAWEMEQYMNKRGKCCTCPCHTYWEPD